MIASLIKLLDLVLAAVWLIDGVIDLGLYLNLKGDVFNDFYGVLEQGYYFSDILIGVFEANFSGVSKSSKSKSMYYSGISTLYFICSMRARSLLEAETVKSAALAMSNLLTSSASFSYLSFKARFAAELYSFSTV